MKVYFSFIKNSLNHPDKKIRQKLIKKYKKNLLKNYESDLNNKIKRLKNLNLTGLIKIDKFVEEWDECIKSYREGRFISTVALCGIIGEKLTCNLIEEMEIKLNNKMMTQQQKEGFFRLHQVERIDLLRDFKIISHEVAGKLHQIREKRNNYVHPIKRKPTNPEKDAKTMINLLEDILIKLYNLVPVSGKLTNIKQPLKLNREKVE
jgi:hypothetical protein